MYDLVVRGGTVVDGTGGPRQVADVGITGGIVQTVGEIAAGAGREEVDATGLIVAPGIIDLHTHYDAQIHWDPYCTTSGWHGSTTVVMGNCGFGFAPVRPGSRDRYMRMMENTEQIPFAVMQQALPWTWSTFPEWMAHLRRLPKGVNVAQYLPTNALIAYVIGADEAKARAWTDAERAELARLLDEAMDAGASGFALSHLGAEGNSHVDHDQSPMPTDIMPDEEIYRLADVLGRRGEGTIMLLGELPGMKDPRRDVAEEVARRSGRPVLFNITMVNDRDPEQHREFLRWLETVHAKGLNIWGQAFAHRKPLDINPMFWDQWNAVPIFRTLSHAVTVEEKMALVSDPAYRKRFHDEYDPKRMTEAGGRIERYILVEAPGSEAYEAFVGQRLEDVAAAMGKTLADAFLDSLFETEMRVLYSSIENTGCNTDYVREMLIHPRVLAGTSDGGAHVKHGNGGFWSSDIIMHMTHETDAMTLEELHHMLSLKSAQAFGLKDIGAIAPGYRADMMVYAFDAFDFQPRGKYVKVNDMPTGDWRKVTYAHGIRHIFVNGVETIRDGVVTGATPGAVVSTVVPKSAAVEIAAE
jgi:N-acyl-D-aspartate/D-glutamate deacylase